MLDQEGLNYFDRRLRKQYGALEFDLNGAAQLSGYNRQETLVLLRALIKLGKIRPTKFTHGYLMLPEEAK